MFKLVRICVSGVNIAVLLSNHVICLIIYWVDSLVIWLDINDICLIARKTIRLVIICICLLTSLIIDHICLLIK